MSSIDKPALNPDSYAAHLAGAMAEVQDARAAGMHPGAVPSALTDENMWLPRFSGFNDGNNASPLHCSTGHTCTDTISPDRSAVHSEYGAQSHRLLTQDSLNMGGSLRTHTDYNPLTGKPIIATTTTVYDGSLVDQIRFNPTTGRRQSEDFNGPLRGREHIEFDARTGAEKTMDWKTSEGDLGHSELDPRTGHMISTWHLRDGSSQRTDRFPDGTDHTVKSDGSSEVVHYGSNGSVQSQDERLADGTTSHTKYSGNVVSTDIRHPDGTTIHVAGNTDPYHPQEYSPQSADIRHRDGSTAHVQYAHNDGEPEKVVERTAAGKSSSFKVDPQSGRWVPDSPADFLSFGR